MKKLLPLFATLILLTGCGKTTGPAVQLSQPTTPVQSCTVTTTAQGATITCPDGTSSFISNGIPGADGLNGTNGTPGTQISEVQLCASTFVPTYPSVFPEFALCIGGGLIGVYSANGGFLAELPPGSYSSNGINASCNFTIGADCQVTD